MAHEAGLEQLWSPAAYGSLRMLSLDHGCASRPTPPPPCTSFEARRERFVGELEQTEGWEVEWGSRAKGALLCRASPEEPIKSCPGLVLCPSRFIPSPRPSPTQKSRPASPHLSPSPSGNKIKVARDASTVLRKTQLLSVETADPESCRAGCCPGAGSLRSGCPHTSRAPSKACSEMSQAALRKEKPT